MNRPRQYAATASLLMVVGTVYGAAVWQHATPHHAAPGDHLVAPDAHGADHPGGFMTSHAQTELLLDEWRSHHTDETRVETPLPGTGASTPASREKPRPPAVVFCTRKRGHRGDCPAHGEA